MKFDGLCAGGTAVRPARSVRPVGLHLRYDGGQGGGGVEVGEVGHEGRDQRAQGPKMCTLW